jgi:hypothetical protein
MTTPRLEINRRSTHVAEVWLSRPDVRNVAPSRFDSGGHHQHHDQTMSNCACGASVSSRSKSNRVRRPGPWYTAFTGASGGDASVVTPNEVAKRC